MFYVSPDHSIEPIEKITEHHDISRCFGTMVGAARHPDAPAVTPVFIDTTPLYSGKEILANDWSVDGLEPIGCVGVYIESFPGLDNPRGRRLSPNALQRRYVA